MTTERAPTMFARGEAGARQIILLIGLGVLAFVLGSIFSVGASARIGERLGPLEHEWSALIFRWFFERLWLFAFAPLFGYAIGRFTEISPVRFALTALISGETFSVLLVSAINGFDYLLEDTVGVIARGVTLFLGMLITVRAVQAGRNAAAASQAESNAIAAQRKAEYAQFLAAAEAKPEPTQSVAAAPPPAESAPLLAAPEPKTEPAPVPEVGAPPARGGDKN